MHVVLQPDAADRLQLNVHTTFDEYDGGQNPQPWRVYNHTTGELAHVPKEETDHLITLPAHGSYRLTVLSNTASTDHIYSTQPGGPAGPPGSGPGGHPALECTGVTPDRGDFGSLAFNVTLTGQFAGIVEALQVALILPMGMDAAESVTRVSDTEIRAVFDVLSDNYSAALQCAVAASGRDTKGAWVDAYSPPFYLTAAGVIGPTITGCEPTEAPAAGGTPVTLRGTGFTTVTAVAVGGNDAENLVVVSDTELTCTTNQYGNSQGSTYVFVMAPEGRAYLYDAFTFV